MAFFTLIPVEQLDLVVKLDVLTLKQVGVFRKVSFFLQLNSIKRIITVYSLTHSIEILSSPCIEICIVSPDSCKYISLVSIHSGSAKTVDADKRNDA